MRRRIIAAAAGAALVALAAITGANAASPTPKLIAFVRESSTSPTTVWVARADGSDRRKLGLGNSPLVAPNGATVAAEGDVGDTVLLYPAGGGRPHIVRLATAGFPIAWSPDARYLAIELLDIDNGSPPGLAVVDAENGYALTMVGRGVVSGASFAPDGSDRIVYASAPSQNPSAPANLHIVDPDGTHRQQITTDGRSLNPVWGQAGIAFDRERFRGKDAAPAYQVWLKTGSKLWQLTHLAVPPLLVGLVPIASSANGNRLLASYMGEDTDFAWTIQLNPLRVRELKVSGELVQGGAISASGTSLLVDHGAFESPADDGTVETVGWAGGRPRKLDRGAEPSWNL